jgi:hypothetical protein
MITGLLLAGGSAYANWRVQTDEADPFDNTKRTFRAIGTGDDGVSLGVRCVDGQKSMMAIIPAGTLTEGNTVHLTIAIDSKPTHPEFDGRVLSIGNSFLLGGMAGVEFGYKGDAPFSFLRDAKKIYVKAATGNHIATYDFFDNGNLNDVLDRAEKACAAPS